MASARRRPLRRILLLGGLFLLVLLIALVVIGWRLWEDVPTYYRPLTFATPDAAELAEQRAERFEYQTGARLTQQRTPEDTWTLTISERRVNEWLATRMRRWAENQEVELPDWLVDPVVVFEPGRVLIAARLELPDLDQVITLVYEPVVPDAATESPSDEGDASGAADGDAAATAPTGAVVAMRLTRVVSGRLPLPPGFVLDRVFEALDLPAERAAEIMAMVRHLPLRLEIEGGRSVDVLKVAITAEQVVLTCRTRREGSGD